jgi:hypothetical protein
VVVVARRAWFALPMSVGSEFDDRKVVDTVERGLLGLSRAGPAAHRSEYGASSHKVNPKEDPSRLTGEDRSNGGTRQTPTRFRRRDDTSQPIVVG